jgi:hypothetical protein
MQSKQKKMLLVAGVLAALAVLVVTLLFGSNGSMFKGSLAELDDGSLDPVVTVESEESALIDGGEAVVTNEDSSADAAAYNVSCVLSASKDPWSLSYLDPDLGTGYAKWNRPNSLNIDLAAPNALNEVSRDCTQSVYNNLSAVFCPANPGVEYDLSYNVYLVADGSLLRNERSSIVTGWGSGVRRCPSVAPVITPSVPVTNLNNMKAPSLYAPNNAQVIKVKR